MSEGAAVPSRAAEPFYSAALRAIEQGKGAPRRANAATWRQWMDGALRRGEFKQGERDWLGIDAWLEAQQGPVRREALADFVRVNEVQVREVVLGDASGAGPTADGGIEDGQDAERAGVTRYETCRIAGGTKYRELLLTLPSEPIPVDLRWEQQTDDMLIAALPSGRLAVIVYDSHALENGATLNTCDTDGESGDRETQYPSVEAAKAAAMGVVKARGEDRPGYRSHHWSQENVIVHVRFDERTDADGRRVLFVQEIQSDWHQEGRRKGYGPQDLWQVVDANGCLVAQQPTKAEADVIAEQCRAGTTPVQLAAGEGGMAVEVRLGRAAAEGVPDAPFKRSEEWAVLAVKRMVRWAVDHDIDRIAWISGDAAVELMGLGRNVDAIRWSGHNDTNKWVRVFWRDASEQALQFEIDAKGIVCGTAPVRAYGMAVAGRPLQEILGKRLAERVLEVPYGEVRGDGLALGGDGLRTFYDRIVPSAVNRWARPFGARVEAMEVLRTTPEQSAIVEANARSAYGEGSPAYTQAMANMRVVAHGLEITPAMQIAVRAGQPLFRRSHQVSEGMSIEAAAAVVGRFMERYRGQVALRFRLAATQEDVYGPGATIEQQGVIKGGFHPEHGVLALVSGNHRDAADLERTLRHEIVGHYGLACLDTADRRALLRTLIAARESPGLDALWRRVDAAYADRSELERAEEVFAMAAEEPMGALGKAWTTVLAMLARALRRVGLVDEPITLSEVHDLAIRIGAHLRGAKAPAHSADAVEEPHGAAVSAPGFGR